jgi:pimeloyl-ACP methyl ester carboxylesterase
VLLAVGAVLVADFGSSSTRASALSADQPAAAVTRLVDIGGGRQIYLQCRGHGSPTVVLVSGAVGAHDDWTHVIDQARPEAAPQRSRSAVFPQVARFTRVCAYDRPGTTLLSGEPASSGPASEQTTAQSAVADLAALLKAAGERGPYVLVGASWGGMLVDLFARSYPAQVAGLAFVDGASEFLEDTLTAQQWRAWTEGIAALVTSSPGTEVPDYPSSVDEIRSAGRMPAVPAVVLTSDRPWDLQVGDAGTTWPAWTAAQDRLARLLRARHLTDTNSSHPINLEQPGIVVHAIRDVVREVRRDR